MAWTSPKTWTDNVDVLSASNLNTHLRDNMKAQTEWTTYTPTWTATGGTPTLGNGTLTGAYVKAGNLCHFWFRLVFGSTTSVGTTSAWTFTLPVPTAAGAYTVFPVHAFDSGTAFYMAFAQPGNGSQAFVPVGNATGIPWAYNSPFTWTTNDTIVAAGTFQC